MPRQPITLVDNNFTNGLITEATGLNFPQNAVTETFDCEFKIDGSVSRRLGFDFEASYITKTIDRTNSVVNTYLWRNVAGDGDVTVLVVQVGTTVYFYRTTGDTFSTGAVATTVTLTPVSGAPTPETTEAQYSDGNGYLFITHPYCEPMRVSYNTSTDVASATNITLKIRDFEGATADANVVDVRATETLAGMSVSHKYNLYNQGWNTTNLTAWDTAQTTMPSNADVMWQFKDATNNFDASTASIARITAGNTPAPKGHFILTLSNQDRDTAAGTTGVAATTTGHQRPSTSAFFAGRVFYSGVNYTGFNSKIYFTQIVERLDQYGACHQTNDPTAEDLFDILPSDGGVISIPEAGTIYKLVAVPGGLAVFAARGVWFITGSTGIGFTAVDYSQQKISEVLTISATSFVNIAGFPSWWNAEGIYVMVANSNSNLPSIQDITRPKIKSFYDLIPLDSKKFARGIYHPTSGHVRWLYRSEGTLQLSHSFEFDRVLNLNTLTGAFFPWTISNSNVKVNSFVFSDISSGAVSANTVIDGSGNNVIDGSGNTVIAFEVSGLETAPFDKYLVSYPNGGSYDFTFADRLNEDYLDWFQYDLIGIDYMSYFISGFKVLGNASTRFGSNYVRVFSRLSASQLKYYFQGIWDFATTGSGTGRWSSRQLVEHTDTNYSNASKRLKVRGYGTALQFKVTSFGGEAFDIIGWGNHALINRVP